MAVEPNETNSLPADIESLRRSVVRSESLLQFDLLDCLRLQQFSNARGVRIFGSDTILDLWKSGILRADAVWSKSSENSFQLPIIAKRDGGLIYSDTRQVPDFSGGLGGLFASNSNKLEEYQPYFHPFRYYTLFHVNRIFTFSISSTQYLYNADAINRIVGLQVEQLDANSEVLSQLFENYNRDSELCIVMEPSVYREIFKQVRVKGRTDYAQLNREVESYDEALDNFVRKIGQTRIHQTIFDLCRNAELLDENKILHVLLRLMTANERLKLTSALGGSIFLRTMAEVLRRTTERALNIELPEEDEIGFGEWMPGVRKSLYGAERIIDAPSRVRRNFLGRLGLDSGIKVRCYVEGATERGAFASAFSEFGSIEFIDLAGRVVQRGGKGLAFAHSLENDKAHHIFSVVCLDADRDDNLRTLRKACANGRMFGRIFISTPNFEFANFTKGELFKICQNLAIEQNFIAQPFSVPDKKFSDFRTVEDLLKFINLHYLTDICKGEKWGAALMGYALKHSEMKEMRGKRAERPCIEIANCLQQLSKHSYIEIEGEYSLNCLSGKLETK